jgi:3-methylfumaryl-CoA hydratase
VSDVRDWIGRTTTTTVHLDPAQANHMAATLDRDPGYRSGDRLPPGWHWLYFHDLAKASDLGPEGHPRLGIVMPPVLLPRRVWAGGTLSFRSPLVLGEAVERTSVIRAITAKKGGSGSLCFVTVEHTLRTEGSVNLVEEQTIVYGELAKEPEHREVAAAPTDADYSERYELDSTVLFRYSALTFNGHRIHYDVDYCREVEGYPNLVIHGPLIATLLLDLHAQQGLPLERFTYRARSLLFLPHAFTVNGKAGRHSAQLWASNHLGGLAMEAEAGAG